MTYGPQSPHSRSYPHVSALQCFLVLILSSWLQVVVLVSEFTSVHLGVSNQLLTVLGLVLGLVISFRTSSATRGVDTNRIEEFFLTVMGIKKARNYGLQSCILGQPVQKHNIAATLSEHGHRSGCMSKPLMPILLPRTLHQPERRLKRSSRKRQ